MFAAFCAALFSSTLEFAPPTFKYDLIVFWVHFHYLQRKVGYKMFERAHTFHAMIFLRKALWLKFLCKHSLYKVYFVS